MTNKGLGSISPTEAAKPSTPSRRYVVAITGASGAIYGLRLVDVLLRAGHEVDVVISPAGRDVIKQELDLSLDLSPADPACLIQWLAKTFDRPAACAGKASGVIPQQTGATEAKHEPAELSAERCHLWHYQDWGSPLASGSAARDGMVVCPCSLATLAAIVHGLSDNLIRRAAEVHLKERRPLVLVPRETPLSAVQLRNLYLAAKHGMVVLPAMPGFYHRPQTVLELVDFIVARVCDHLGVRHELVRPWSGKA